MPGDDHTNPAFPEVVDGLHLHVQIEGDVVEIPLPAPLAGEYVAGDRRWVTSMLQAIKLGMQLEMFIGQRDIESFATVDGTRSAPTGASARMVLFDTIPGGTGYLLQLQRRFAAIMARAHHHLVTCECEHACYRCLKDFWNQRDHALLDKQLILPTLALLAQETTGDTKPAMSQREIFDSFVEAELHRLLLQAGVPAPRMGRDNVLRASDERGVLQMDLSWPDQHLLVLIDGREFHTREVAQVLADQDKRNEALAAGWRILEFTAWEVLNHPDAVIADIAAALGGSLAGGVAVEPTSVDAAASGGTQLTVVAAPISPALAALASKDFTGASRVMLDGHTMRVLAVSADMRRVIVPVDAAQWVNDPVVWRAALSAMRRLTLAGVTSYRIPVERLDDAESVHETLQTLLS